mgnify:CR=1 FL=1
MALYLILIRQIGLKPFKSNLRNSVQFQFFQQNIMIYGIQRILNCKKDNSCYFNVIDKLLNQSSHILNQGRKSRIAWPKAGLKLRYKVTFIHVFIQLLEHFLFGNLTNYGSHRYRSKITVFVYRSNCRIFPVSTNSPVDIDKLKINVKDEYITSAAIRSIFAGILSVPVLLDTFRYLRVIKNFSTGICEK